MGAYYCDEGPLGEFIQQKNNPITANRSGFIKGAGHGCETHGPNNPHDHLVAAHNYVRCLCT